MTAIIYDGQTDWRMTRNRDGHRDYTIVHQVLADPLDGPQVVLNTPGLPTVGSIWLFDNDVDSWAFCTPQMTLTPRIKGEPNRIWDVAQVFSTNPLARCQDDPVEDPLLEPQKIAGGFTKFTTDDRTLLDRNGDAIVSISHEPFRGLVYDDSRPNVTISQNVASLELSLLVDMVDTVNDAELWGFGARQVKLSSVTWERKYYETCTEYYTRKFSFDINENTFDKILREVGTRTLKEGGVIANPNDWELATDENENPLGEVALNNAGQVAAAGEEFDAQPEYYPQDNLLLLGIPSTIG